MKLDFSCPPLNIYTTEKSQYLLNTINRQLPNSGNNFNYAESVAKSLITQTLGIGVACLVDNISTGLKGKKANKCLSDLIIKQTNRIIKAPSTIIEEAQINIMATLCVTDCLSDVESNSVSLAAKNIGKVALGLIQLKNPLNVISESALEHSSKYDDICQIYHIAFLLTVYNSLPKTEIIIKQLIIESLSKDSSGYQSFSSKDRPLLFSNTQYKSVCENLTYRLDSLIKYAKGSGDLHDIYIQWRKEFNASLITYMQNN